MSVSASALQTWRRWKLEFRTLLVLVVFAVCVSSRPIPDISQEQRAMRFLEHYEQMKQQAGVSLYGGEFGVIQGDIILTDATVDAIASRALPKEYVESRTRRAVTSISLFRWENATVPFVFDEGLSLIARQKVNKAITHWHKKTCIRFVHRTTEETYIRFMNDTVCASPVGRQPYWYLYPDYQGQPVKLTRQCANQRGNIIHEIGHAIGFWHEHVRVDRNQYVEILWDNIIPGHADNFHIKPQTEIDSLGVEYDFTSIMHYPLYAFSVNGEPTIRILEPYVNSTDLDEVGQRDHLSELDIRQANLLYACGVEDRTTEPPVPIYIVKTGEPIALKATGSSRHFWLNCTQQRCRFDGCPGNRFKMEKMSVCTDHIFTLQKLDAGRRVKVGDRAVLRQTVNGSEQTVYCTPTGCVSSAQCEVDGEFSTEICRDQVLVVKVPGKSVGENVMHKDEVILEHEFSEVSETCSWIDCNLESPRLCRKKVCVTNHHFELGSGLNQPDNICDKERFVLYKL